MGGDRELVASTRVPASRRTINSVVRVLWFRVVPALVLVLPLLAQNEKGELRFTISDKAGATLVATADLSSEGNHYRSHFGGNQAGEITAKRVPYGIYKVVITSAGFASYSGRISVHSALPLTIPIVLDVAVLQTSVTVTEQATLVDPSQTGAVNRVGVDTLDRAPASLPGRSVVDLVNTQPGWLFEGNAVLHPRGSEYVTQFVLDGIPLTDNRSPSFGVALEGEDVQSMSIYTAGFPAEYGRKLGGVIDINTAKDSRQGFHGTAVGSGGSFSTLNGYFLGQYVSGRNTVSATTDGSHTDRYLNPPVEQNYTNSGTTGDYSLRFERDVSDRDRVSVLVRHGVSRFEIPDEQVQYAAQQRQDRDNSETIGIATYQHIFSPSVLMDVRGMVRDNTQEFWANSLSTPIIPSQDRGFREGYLKSTLSAHKGRHEWKAGLELDATHIRESFAYLITDLTQFDLGTPAAFHFEEQKWDLEQSAFVQDQIKLGTWNISAGLRYDRYRLVEHRSALSPRLAISRYFANVQLLLHASYDRAFQTPSSENILLSSSSQVTSLNPNFLRLPVAPSLGNYYEVGFTKGLFGKMKLDGNLFDRRMNNYLDDDQLLNTGVSFPITFSKARLYGAEAKLEVPRWKGASGSVSYSYIVGSAYFPVSGGLFLGQDVANTLNGLGRFWDTQDQRNTIRAHGQYEINSRCWIGGGAEYGSGLPVDFNGTVADALEQYGSRVVSRVNFDHGRVSPSLAIDASFGADLIRNEKRNLQLQIDGENLNNRLNVLDFAGLFSGNAIAPPRSYNVRLKFRF